MLRTLPIAAMLVIGLVGSTSARGASPDLSTPKKAATEFARGLETGDMAVVKAASIGSADDLKVAEMIGDLIRSARALRKTAIERFGAAGGQVLPSGDALADFSKRIEGGTEKIAGNTATVGPADQPDALTLAKSTDGGWRVDLAALPAKDEIRRLMPAVQKVFAAAEGDIRVGKYKTLDQARDLIGQQMFATIAQRPTTEPVPKETKAPK